MNDTVATLGLALGSAFTAGINLYATIAALGLAAAAGAIQLPPELQVLAHPAVIAVALGLYLVEFFADKTPYLDSAWDAVHTFIRVPAGAILAARAVGPVSPPLELIAVLAGGSVALAAHATKASTRIAINTSPEPFSNWIASFAEDVMALAGIWVIFHHPLVMLGFVAVFMVAVAWTAPKLWRALRSLFQRGRRRSGYDESTAAKSRAPEGGGEVPSGASREGRLLARLCGNQSLGDDEAIAADRRAGVTAGVATTGQRFNGTPCQLARLGVSVLPAIHGREGYGQGVGELFLGHTQSDPQLSNASMHVFVAHGGSPPYLRTAARSGAAIGSYSKGRTIGYARLSA